MVRRKKQALSVLMLIVVLLLVTVTALTLAESFLENPLWQRELASFGYLGVVVIAIIAGLNVILPIPAVAFTPMFTAAGLSLLGIIFALTVGTIIADFIGYVFGRLSRDTIVHKYPTIVHRLEKIQAEHRSWLTPIIFLYAAFMPIPNEALILPLAFLDVRWRAMLIPLFLGNLLNQAIYAYGMHTAFRLLF